MNVVLAGTLHGHGGVQTHLFWMAKALLEAGAEVHVLSLGEPLSSQDECRLSALKGSRNLSTIDFKKTKSPQTLLSRLVTTISIITKLRKISPDIYFCCGYGWNLLLPAVLSGVCQRRIFFEVMSGDPYHRRDPRHLLRIVFHQVVAQATEVAKKFKHHFKWSHSIKVLPAFPEPLELTAQLPSLKKKRVPLGTAKAAYFGRLVPHKGVLWLIKQWSKLQPLIGELHIFGTGPEEDSLRAFVRDHQLESKIFLHGTYQGGQEYVQALARFDLTLLPTTGSEGAPLVLLESMACGVPFVANGVGGIPDYVNQDCVLNDPQTPDQFVNSVMSLVLSLDSGQIDQPRLQKFYLENFSFIQLSKQWRSFLLGDEISSQKSSDHDRSR